MSMGRVSHRHSEDFMFKGCTLYTAQKSSQLSISYENERLPDGSKAGPKKLAYGEGVMMVLELSAQLSIHYIYIYYNIIHKIYIHY